MDANVKAGQNPEEPFDVVDEQDRVIGRAPRREVHARRLRHRSIHVLVFDQAGHVFLQKRSQAKDSCPGSGIPRARAISMPARITTSPPHASSARRSDSCRAAPPERWLRLEASERTGWEFVWVYRLRSEGPFVLNPAEIESGAWFAPAEVDAGLRDRPEEFAGAFRYLWPLVRAKM
jgi:isopentenyl-diphosphate delta-isomerase